jgi:HPt (histidine-containing phosphotransfer) domain-containing protein
MNPNVLSRARNQQTLTAETPVMHHTVGVSAYSNRPVLNRQELTTRVGGDEAFVDELCALFRSSSRTLLGELQAALKRADAHHIIANAHTLKGAALNIGAPTIARHAQWLEEAARERDWGLAATAWRMLQDELFRLEAEIDQTGKAR